MEYICKVGTPAGEIVERRFDAPSDDALKADLARQGLHLFSHKRASAGFSFSSPRVKTENLQLFGQELAALLKAGLPLAQSMDLMVERTALRVEETGEYIQSQVLDPVREVSAIVIGIKVAVETPAL